MIALKVLKMTPASLHSALIAFALALGAAYPAAAEDATRTLRTALTAEEAYETGQVYDVMRSPGGAGVQLNDLMLVENDGPGAGRSDKGVHQEALHRGVQVKKTLHLDDPRAREAHVVLYMESKTADAPAPYHLLVNGHRVPGVPPSWHERVWWWVPVPVEYLVAGDNEIVVLCEAPEGEGYDLLFARADEYARGGGAYTYRGHTGLLTSGFVEVPDSGILEGLSPFTVGESSARSTDGGATWRDTLLGPDADTQGEYVIRLSLNRFHPTGTLVSPPIDLWTEAKDLSALVGPSTATALRLTGTGETPDGTGIAWAIRFGNSPDPTDPRWGDFAPIGSGPTLDAALPDTAHRFAQIRVTLTTDSPLASPTFHALEIHRDVHTKPPPANTVYVRRAVNPTIRYPSHPFHFESDAAPELAQIRATLPQELLVGAAHGQFAEVNQLRHYVSQLWYHGLPHPDYPEWNALDILRRKDRYGYGGMCIQFTIVFVQALQSLGYQARHVNVFNHEVPEVYIDELEKWVLVDPESVFDSYEFNTETGAPLNALEQHGHFLKRYGFSAERPIPWASPEPWANWGASGQPEVPQPLEISTFTGWINDPDPAKRPPQHNLAGFFRIIPRNDFLTRPTPRPVAHGSTYWPWSGYLCWYDAATPRKLQHALHSDRVADFYPTLNRVRFTATHGNTEGEVRMAMTTQTPNFAAYEININGSGWTESPAEFTWTFYPSALNRLEMRVRNAFGLAGKPSELEVFYHYREPYRPKETP